MLYFDFASFWRQAVVFNLTVYRDYLDINSGSSIAPFVRNLAGLMSHAELALHNGFLVAAVLLLIGGFPFRSVVWRTAGGSALVGLLLLGTTGSGKDYHFLILVPWILVAYLLIASSVPSDTLKALYGIFALIAILELGRLASLHGCIFRPLSPCPSPYSAMVAASEGHVPHHFLINQGWPYLLANSTPEVSFTARFAFLPDESQLLERLLKRKTAGDVFWLSDDTLDYTRIIPGSGVEVFMSEMQQHGPSVGPFTAFSMRPGGQDPFRRGHPAS